MQLRGIENDVDSKGERCMGADSPGAHRMLVRASVIALLAACATAPAPGDTGYAYNVEGTYVGRLVVDREAFEATLDMHTGPGGRVSGSFAVRAPLQIDGDVSGTVIDDLLRVTLSYASGAEDGGGGCPGTIEGILTVSPGGGTVGGPVTISDCVDRLTGSLTFRRAVRP